MSALRLATYERPGEWAAAVVVADGRLVDAAAAARRAGLGDGGSWTSVRRILGEDADRVSALADGAEAVAAQSDPEVVLDAGSVRLGPPVPDPQKILCVGLNYRAHADEASLDEPPVPLVFAKFPNVLIGSGAAIELPETNSERVDYEGEVAIVIGRRAYRLSEEDALSAVAGWMPFNDVSARDLQTQTSQWTVGKSPDTFGPCGPHLVLDDAVRDGGLELETQVNGERVQHAHTDQMIFSVARLLAFLTMTMTLVPGDIIVTGTPQGVGAHRDPPRFLRDGDVVEVRVADERLSNPVRRRAASASSTSRGAV
jgi:acylpyruvate hydrolase